MTISQDTAPVAVLKAQAKRLREKLRGSALQISHGEALEMLAHQHGVRDWNTLRAMAGNRVHLRVGDRVEGSYLNQPFSAAIRNMNKLRDGAHRRITLHLDEAVDVVRFDSFSSFRQRITGVIVRDGTPIVFLRSRSASLFVDGTARPLRRVLQLLCRLSSYAAMSFMNCVKHGGGTIIELRALTSEDLGLNDTLRRSANLFGEAEHRSSCKSASSSMKNEKRNLPRQSFSGSRARNAVVVRSDESKSVPSGTPNNLARSLSSYFAVTESNEITTYFLIFCSTDLAAKLWTRQ